MENVTERIVVSCLVAVSVSLIWFRWDARKEAKRHTQMTSEYTQFILDKMKVQDLENGWADGGN